MFNQRLFFRIAIFNFAVCFATSASFGQDHIVLRDLTLLKEFSIAEMNLDGIHLRDGKQIAWSEIKQGSVGDLQATFDQFLKEIGEPLFRLQNRLANRDYSELRADTKKIMAQIDKRRSLEDDSKFATGVTEFFANAGQYHLSISQGNRAQALVPLLQLLKIRDQHRALGNLDFQVGLDIGESGVVNSLLPVWLDSDYSANALKEINSMHLVSNPAKFANSVTFKVYACSLSIVADPQIDLSRWQLPSDWKTILSAQSLLLNKEPARAREVLGTLDNNLAPEQKAIAVYYEGLAAKQLSLESTDKVSLESQYEWIMQMLRVPAQYETKFPELSAAAIYQVVQDGDINATTKNQLHSELVERFPNTYFGRQCSSTHRK